MTFLLGKWLIRINWIIYINTSMLCSNAMLEWQQKKKKKEEKKLEQKQTHSVATNSSAIIK